MKKIEDIKCKWRVLLLFVLCPRLVIEVSCQPTSKVFNENATLLFHPHINATQAPMLINSTGYDLLQIKKLPWHCLYSGDIEEAENESECYCEGAKFEKIPQILPNFTRLSISNAKLKVLKEIEMRKYSHYLKDIHLTNLKEFYLIEPGVFKGFNQLRTIYISYAPKLFYIAGEVFRNISHTFKTLRIIHSGLREIPDLRFIHDNVDIISHLDFEGNQISEIPEKFIRVRTEELIIDNNALIHVHRAAFNGSFIGILSLKGNPNLRDLNNLAFEGIQDIRELDLSGTSIVSLPSKGLEKLEFLRIQNVQSLTQIPSVYNFETLAKAYLTHSFHCCAFKFPSRHDPSTHQRLLKAIEELKSDCIGLPPPSDVRKSINDHFDMTPGARKLKRSSRVNDTRITETFMDEGQDEFGDFDLGVYHKPVVVSNTSTVEVNCKNIGSMLHKFQLLLNGERNVHCFPKPDALNPCEDVMGSNWLRVSVWIVVSLAVFGNTAVIIVLFSRQSEFTVPKFLMLNLAVADLCMGLYLLLVAIQDLRSMGEYFNYAFMWQYGWGCRAAGWLTVFAGHLSVFTLTIITVERYFAITRAIYLNKRLKIKAASYIMICGWLYSIAMATLPLFGISNYSSTSICLPMESLDISDMTYLITVLTLNGLGFFIVVICYAQIYFSLGVETRHFNAGEMTVAKKMALLVFTNFACWAPIAFFGLTALAGYPLINVTKSKILLVFFYPLNSCANPYLYAILTAQYRRDLSLLLSKFGICKQRAQQYRMNFSNPTHTIPLHGLPSTRTSNSHSFRKNSTNNNAKLNTQEQILLRTNFAIAADNNENEHEKCLPVNGKSSEDADVNRESAT